MPLAHTSADGPVPAVGLLAAFLWPTTSAPCAATAAGRTWGLRRLAAKPLLADGSGWDRSRRAHHRLGCQPVQFHGWRQRPAGGWHDRICLAGGGPGQGNSSLALVLPEPRRPPAGFLCFTWPCRDFHGRYRIDTARASMAAMIGYCWHQRATLARPLPAMVFLPFIADASSTFASSPVWLPAFLAANTGNTIITEAGLGWAGHTRLAPACSSADALAAVHWHILIRGQDHAIATYAGWHCWHSCGIIRRDSSLMELFCSSSKSGNRPLKHQQLPPLLAFATISQRPARFVAPSGCGLT